MMDPSDPTRDLRRLVYGLLISLAAGLTLGRIASAERLNEPSVHKADKDTVPRPAWPKSRPEPWPTFSSNDRSRWAVVRALVEEGTWVIGRRDPIVVLSGAPAALAATTPLEEIALLQAGYALRIASDRGIVFEDGFQTVDKILNPATFEFYSTKPPLLTALAAGEHWVFHRALGWSLVQERWLVVRSVLVTMNLLPLILYLALLARLVEPLGMSDWGRLYVVAAAGFATLVTPFLVSFNNHTLATTGALVTIYAVVRIREGGGVGWFALAGLAGGFTACNDLPALALTAGLGCYLLVHWPGRTLLGFLPGALMAPAAMLILNYLQMGEWVPAYSKFGGPWYEYEGSHWRLPPGGTKRGIDFAGVNGEPKSLYAFHLLLGHHGWFSLMPIMFLALPGMVMGLARWKERSLISLLALLNLLVSGVVIAYYLHRSDNYGGWSNGPRWLMWLTPMWLLTMLPMLDVLARSRLGRGLGLGLLALSILSMSYQMWNPWRHPWIYNWMETRGWINY